MNNGLRCADIGLTLQRTRGGEKTVLRHIDVDFKPGRIALISGITGSGKTSLLHLLAGLLRPSSGALLDGDRPVSRWTVPHLDRWRRRAGIVFQHPRLFGDLTVLENVMLPMIPRARSIGRLRRSSLQRLDDLSMAHTAGERADMLSGGESQRVSVARALVSQPEILIADEPTAHQDTAGTALVLAALKAATTWNAVVVVASHDPRVKQRPFADDVFCLADGRIEAQP